MRKQPGQMRAHHPAAAHFFGWTIKIFFAKAQPGENLLRLGFELVAAEFIEAIVDVIVNFFGMNRGDVRVIIVPSLDDAAEFEEFRRDGGGEFDNRFVTGWRAFLRRRSRAKVSNRTLLTSEAGTEWTLPGLSGS